MAVSRRAVAYLRRVADYVWHEKDPAGRTHEIVLAPPGSALDLGQPRWHQRDIRLLFFLWPVWIARWVLTKTGPLRGLLGSSWRVSVVLVDDQTLHWIPPRPHREAFASEESARLRIDEVRRAVLHGDWRS